MASELPGPAKWVAVAISTRADRDTCVVPDAFAWSLAELADATGYSTATVKRHLALLEDEGWVKRARAVGARTGYSLFIPDAGSERASNPAQDEPQAQSEPPAGSERASDRLTESQPYKEVHQVHPSDHSSSSATPPREDVERICKHLADRMIANGCKPPTITKKWRDAARLLLDKDGRTEEQVHRAIEWATAHHFWAANILSLPTLREKYDQLRLRAEQERDAANGQRASPRQSTEPAPYHRPWTPEED